MWGGGGDAPRVSCKDGGRERLQLGKDVFHEHEVGVLIVVGARELGQPHGPAKGTWFEGTWREV